MILTRKDVLKLNKFELFVASILAFEDEATTTDKYNEILQKYSMTRFMKLLYFACLESHYSLKNGKVLPYTAGLFFTFDNFKAYPNGPVEETIYLNRNNPQAFSMFNFDGDYLQVKKSRQLEKRIYAIKKRAIRGGEGVDSALWRLYQRRYVPSQLDGKGAGAWYNNLLATSCSFKNQELKLLINASHSLVAWKACYYGGGSNDISAYLSKDGDNLNAEVNAFNNFNPF